MTNNETANILLPRKGMSSELFWVCELMTSRSFALLSQGSRCLISLIWMSRGSLGIAQTWKEACHSAGLVGGFSSLLPSCKAVRTKGKASHFKTECVVFTHKACFLIVKLALTYLAGSLSRLKNVNMSDKAPFHRELCEYKIVECNFSIKKKNTKKPTIGTSLKVQWLRLHASSAGGVGLIPGGRTKIPHASQHSQKIKNKPTSITYKIK